MLIRIVSCLAMFLLLCGCGVAPTVDPPVQSEQQRPPIPVFDGGWLVSTTFDPGEDLRGGSSYVFTVRDNQPLCVDPSRTGLRTNLGIRPVTDEDGIVVIRLMVPVPPSHYDSIDFLKDETRVEVTIFGRLIEASAPDDNPYEGTYDVLMIERFIFSEELLTSTGTMRFHHYSVEYNQPCENRAEQ